MIRSHVDCPHCAHNARQIDVLITQAAMLQRVIELLDRTLSLPEYQRNPYLATNNGNALATNTPAQGETIPEACILTSLQSSSHGPVPGDCLIYIYHQELETALSSLGGPNGKHLIAVWNATAALPVNSPNLNIYVPKGAKIGFESLSPIAAASSFFVFANLIPAKDTSNEQFRGRN